MAWQLMSAIQLACRHPGFKGSVRDTTESMARHFFGNRPAVGRQIDFNKESYEIIGLAKDAKYIDLRAASPRVLYFSALQRRGGVNAVSVRTAGSPAAFAGWPAKLKPISKDAKW